MIVLALPVLTMYCTLEVNQQWPRPNAIWLEVATRPLVSRPCLLGDPCVGPTKAEEEYGRYRISKCGY